MQPENETNVYKKSARQHHSFCGIIKLKIKKHRLPCIETYSFYQIRLRKEAYA